jgi:hypothetical protein
MKHPGRLIDVAPDGDTLASFVTSRQELVQDIKPMNLYLTYHKRPWSFVWLLLLHRPDASSRIVT